MAILAECPTCHVRQGISKKRCSCGESLDKAKNSKRVTFWVAYRIPNGKDENGKPVYLQRQEPVGNSIELAKDAEGKRRGQKRENKIFDEILPEVTMTFRDLAAWYLDLEKVKALKSCDTVSTYLGKFCQVLGNTIVKNVKLADLENLQEKRKREGLKPKTIDDELNYAKSMIIKAFDNDMVSGKTLKTFRRLKPMLTRHANRRDRILTIEEFKSLYEKAPRHLKDILTIGYWTGMRKGEIINLAWDRVDLKAGFIRLEASDTKEGHPKTIPIGKDVNSVFSKLPRPIHGGEVFLYYGRPILNRFETAMKTACRKAGIAWGREEKGGFIFHDLRHTFVTDMRRAGVPRTVTMSITGHAITDMNERYDTVEDWEKLDAVKKLEGYRLQSVNKVLTANSQLSDVTG